MPYSTRLLLAALAALALLLLSGPVQAHPAPFSYIDLDLHEQRIEGTVTVHASDLAHELGIEEPSILFDQSVLSSQYADIKALMAPRIHLSDGNGAAFALEFNGVEAAQEDDAIRLHFTVEAPPPAALMIAPALFPFDPTHQTFVNVHEDGALQQQFLFAEGSTAQTHYAGTAAGVLATLATFIPSGAQHVLIGPDHVLFLIGLILLGGSLRRLALIVTMFTLGHSITLALAALDIFAPPAWLIEPLIALSIVVVGVDNLLRKPGDRDLRPLFAVAFGLIHGFGFAFVLREFGLPAGNLGWSLLGFNLGVELGQLAVVIPFTLLLVALRSYRPDWTKHVVVGGSLAVVLAGAYWFVDRVWNLGSG